MTLPSEVQSILKTLTGTNFEAYAVGGCVRDVLLKKQPKDWDVATNAKPEEIQKLFPKNFYTNEFGTVTVLTGSSDPILKEVEITTYRVEDEYRDQRHPDHVRFVTDITEDLARRDFTINAMAMNEHKIIDPHGGQKDLEAKIIRAVGEAKARFSEDALRLLRAVRFAAELNFEIEPVTFKAIREYAPAIDAVSHERVRDELTKLVMSKHPEMGMNLLQDTGLVGLILPELADGIEVKQNRHHIYTVFEHNVKSLQYAAKYEYSLPVRWAALLHDIGKPRTRRYDKKLGDFTFYAHEIVGARMAEKLLKRLHFSRKLTDKIVHLIRHHMFYYDVGKVTETGARRLLRRVGKDHFGDLIKLRIAERKGSGVPKAEPYRLRHLQFMVEKAAQAPISVKELKVTGKDLQQELGLTPGPIFGGILSALLAEVLDDPKKNTREYLLDRSRKLKDKDPKELKKLGEAAAEEAEKEREDNIRRKYHV